MTTHASLLQVSDQAWGEIPPRAADVHVTLTADRLFSGRAALANAEELRHLVDGLTARGVPEDAIALEGASLDVSTGLFTRSSSVTYRVRIHLTDLDRVAEVIDVIAGCKRATMNRIAWDYTGSTAEIATLLAHCAAGALAKATALASALGVTIAGVHEIHEDELATSAPPSKTDHELGMRLVACKSRSAMSIASELAGIELAPRRPHGVRVRVTYRLAANAS